MKTRRRFAAIATLLALTTSAFAGTPQQRAQELVIQLQAGEFAQAEASFTPQMAAAAPATALQQLWQTIGTQLGALTNNPEGDAKPIDNEHTMVISRLEFAKGAVQATTVVDNNGKIVGFQLAPVP